MSNPIKKYLSEIGRKGGKKSRRKLTSSQAKNMVKLRQAKRAFQKFYTQCFWSFDRNYKITLNDLDWIVQQLKKNGNQEAWKEAEKLCR